MAGLPDFAASGEAEACGEFLVNLEQVGSRVPVYARACC